MWQDIKLILIDDDAERRHNLQVIFNFLGEEALPCSSTDWFQQWNDLDGKPELIAVILGEVSNGLAEMIDRLSHWDKAVPILLLGDKSRTDSVEANLRRHIIAYVEVPPSYNKLLDSLHRAQVYREQYDISRNRGVQREIQLFRSLVGTSRQVQKVREMMAQVVDKDVTVLISGEPGTGKEVVARKLHFNSHRRAGPFVPINCSAISGELLESELFGHEKGAFEGAISTRVGRFELAEGGTLFIDEIGDMPLHLQGKVLRLLQDNCFERVGGSESLTSDVRIIAATTQEMDSLVEKGVFREDLFYRLNVFPIEMPPLRERAEDIPLLLNELISRMEHEKRGSIRFNSAAIMSLCLHHWHGNVRELANLVERLAIMHPYGLVGVLDLPKKYRHIDESDENNEDLRQMFSGGDGAFVSGSSPFALLPVNGLDLKQHLNDLERSLIKQALEDSNDVVARAAEKLHIRRTTLVEKMRKYGLHRHDDKLEP